MAEAVVRMQYLIYLFCEFRFATFQRVSQQVVNAFVVFIVFVYVGKKNIDGQAYVMQCLDVLFKFEYRFGKLIRTLVHVVADLEGFMQIVPVGIHKEDNVPYRAFLDEIL